MKCGEAATIFMASPLAGELASRFCAMTEEGAMTEEAAARFFVLRFRGQLLIQLHQFRDAFAFGHVAPVEAVGLHDSFIVQMVGFTQHWWHRPIIIEIS